MKRRQFLKRFICTFSLFLIPSYLKSQGAIMSKDDFKNEIESAKTLRALAAFIEKLSSNEKNLKIDGTWSVGTVLAHCAQSIRYSINGYPQMKSAVFRGTIGSLVFNIFSLKGKMSHGLEEPIPGAESLDLQIAFNKGKNDLLDAISVFETKKAEELKPHFAYGSLSKPDYDNAHALHIKNHFERISIS